jgi:hypothetical protein
MQPVMLRTDAFFSRVSAEEKEVSVVLVVDIDCGAEMGLNEGRGFDQGQP